MKICHVILACFYIEDAGYQENMLPKYHKTLGHDVSIVTNSNDWARSPVSSQKTYLNSNSIQVTLLATEKPKFSNHFLQTLYSFFHNEVIGLYEYLCKENPDIIFIHGCQHIGNLEVLKYLKNKNAKLFVDQHGDYYNAPINSLKKKIIARYYMGYIARKLYKRCYAFWGVTPWRVTYLRDVYKLPEEKTHLLIMGGDDEKIDFDNRQSIKQNLRLKYNISDDELLIVTGGKIDPTKNIHLLIEATSKFPNVRLLIFGKAVSSFENEFATIVKANKNVIHIGWINSDEVYNYFLSADLVVFPGTHSVLWEQAVACGVPCIVRYWEGMGHVNVNGNCSFITYDESPSSEAIIKALNPAISDKKVLGKMKTAAETCRMDFLYSSIAQKSIGLQ